MKSLLYTSLTVITILFSACTKISTTLPNTLYTTSYINLHSPNSKGWMTHKHKNGIMFLKKGTNNFDSYVAQLIYYPLDSIVINKDFLKFIKSKSKYRNTERFKTIKSNFKISKLQEYPCVESLQLAKDTEAKVSPTDQRILLLKIKALYCKHPNKNEAFMVGYSFRGKKIPDSFNKEADSFLNSIQITNK